VVAVAPLLPSDHGGNQTSTAAADLTDEKLGLEGSVRELQTTKPESNWTQRRSDRQRRWEQHGGGCGGGGELGEREQHGGDASELGREREAERE